MKNKAGIYSSFGTTVALWLIDRRRAAGHVARQGLFWTIKKVGIQASRYHAGNFIRSNKNGYRPYEIEYETPVTEKQDPVETKPLDNINSPHNAPPALPESKFPEPPEIPAAQPAKTIDSKASQPSNPLTKPIPQPVKTGNEPTHIPGYNLAKILAQVKRR